MASQCDDSRAECPDRWRDAEVSTPFAVEVNDRLFHIVRDRALQLHLRWERFGSTTLRVICRTESVYCRELSSSGCCRRPSRGWRLMGISGACDSVNRRLFFVDLWDEEGYGQ